MPQNAIAQPGSESAAFSKALRAGVYPKEWSAAIPRSKCALASALQETAKTTSPKLFRPAEGTAS